MSLTVFTFQPKIKGAFSILINNDLEPSMTCTFTLVHVMFITFMLQV